MARLLRVSVSWLRAEAEAGRVPSLRAGRTFLFNPEAVEKVLAARAAGQEQPGRLNPETAAG
jgi:excisionase family DNA binding protein